MDVTPVLIIRTRSSLVIWKAFVKFNKNPNFKQFNRDSDKLKNPYSKIRCEYFRKPDDAFL